MTHREAIHVLDEAAFDVASVMYWLAEQEKRLLADRAARIRADIRLLMRDLDARKEEAR